MHVWRRWIEFLLFAMLFAVPLGAQDHPTKASPFDALRWQDDRPEVRVGDTWYRPLAIDGIEVQAILDACADHWPGQVQKRFGEDLVEVLVGLGWQPSSSVDLLVERPEGGAKKTLKGLEMTLAKREAIRRSTADAPAAPPRTLSRAQAESDLERFRRGLRERFAYLELRGIDLDAELERLRAELGDSVDSPELARRLRRLLLRFGDGHADVRAPYDDEPPGDRYLPVLLVESSAGVVAVEPDRSDLVDRKRPVVVSIDGEPIEEWLARASADVVAGSPQLVRERSLRELRWLDRYRREHARALERTVTLELADEDGRSKKKVKLPMADSRPIYGPWPRTETRRLPKNVGYLRIAEMDDDAGSAVRAAMESFEDTEGLVVDVRGNGGGSREALLALAGYLIDPDEPALVANVCAYRLADAFDDDHLESRFAWPATWEGWSERQRGAIEALLPGFEPEWALPDGFSEWHFMVLDRTGDEREYFYDRPVALLCDPSCFSATDVFLGALERLPRVTLVGRPSGGGSARSQAFVLPASGIEVRCASMASFRPDGRLYDGRGIEVDRDVAPTPDWFRARGKDVQLDEALAALRH